MSEHPKGFKTSSKLLVLALAASIVLLLSMSIWGGRYLHP
jgi:hypothetical protein